MEEILYQLESNQGLVETLSNEVLTCFFKILECKINIPPEGTVEGLDISMLSEQGLEGRLELDMVEVGEIVNSVIISNSK